MIQLHFFKSILLPLGNFLKLNDKIVPPNMKNINRIASFLAPLAGFILILFVMNGYQYLKLKTDFAAGMVKEISNTELHELRTFFENIEQKLILIRDWGKNDVLFSNDETNLNKKIIPLLEHQIAISSIVIANDVGNEYFLYRDRANYVSRITTMNDAGTTHKYQEWSAEDSPGRKWQEKSGYDPRKRPWFKLSREGELVNWTGVYPFFHSKEQGITASVSWANPEEPTRYTVFAMDIPLAAIQQILSARSEQRLGQLFLVKGDGNTLILNDAGDDQGKINNILEKLIGQWQAAGKPDKDLVRIGQDNQQWLASFQRLENDKGLFWLGLVTPENEILDVLNRALFSIDFIDLGISGIGGLFILFVMWKNGPFRQKEKSVPPPIVRLNDYIAQGEGVGVEFKSTIRTNLKTGKTGKEIEFAWLKAVVAFLNSNGGALLLGVSDSGEICGVGPDAFENSDRCQLHVKNLVNHHVGGEFSGFIDITLVDFEGRQVVMVECHPPGGAVFLKIGKNEEFYVRSGPSSTKLSPSQMVSFIQQSSN